MKTVTRRVWRRYNPGHVRFTRVGQDLAELLEKSTAEGRHRIYLVGSRPGADGTRAGFESWAFLQRLPRGWSADRHYLGNPMLPVLRFVHDDGRRVEIHRAASWFGEGDYATTEARDALRLVQRVLQDEWGSDDVIVLATPATTGRDLIQRSIPKDVEIPVLDDGLQELIRATSGQGRWEFFDHGDEELPGLHGWDMRFSYAAFTWGLGVGPAELIEGGDFEPYARGRTRARVTVPADWNHVGLLGVPNDVGSWDYPAAPGARFEGWWDNAELHLAAEHGWSFEVVEQIRLSDGRPLDTWRDKLVRCRERVAMFAERGDVTPAVAELARGAFRNLVLHTVGALHARSSPVTKTLPREAMDELPADAGPTLRPVGEQWVWEEPRSAAWREMAHPEWSSAVWARCRARLMLHRPTNTGALTVPKSSLVALRTDAVYLASPPPWTDSGKVGALRPVVEISGPLAAPRTEAELMLLRARARGRALAPPETTIVCMR